MKAKFPGVFELSGSEKLQLVQDLWDNIAATEDDFPVIPELIEELDRRQAEHRRDPDSACTWEDVKEHIRERHGR